MVRRASAAGVRVMDGSGRPHGAGSGSATRRPSMSHRVRAVIGTIGILIVFVVVIGFVVLAVFYLHR
jgi:hypothetical protein